jgi:hypothetical protein
LLFVVIHDILTSVCIKSFNVIGISPYHIESKWTPWTQSWFEDV